MHLWTQTRLNNLSSIHPSIHSSIHPSIHSQYRPIDVLYSHTLPVYWCICMQCLSIDPTCIYTYQCIYYYLSICLSTYLFIRVCVSQISCYIGFHPSILHSFIPFVHPYTLDTWQSRTQWTIFQTTKKKLHRLCMDSWQHNQVKLLDVLAPEGLPPSPVSTNKGNGPTTPFNGQ